MRTTAERSGFSELNRNDPDCPFEATQNATDAADALRAADGLHEGVEPATALLPKLLGQRTVAGGCV